MARALHFVHGNVAGHGTPDTGSIPCSGVYGRATDILYSSSGDGKSLFRVKGVLLQCSSRKPSSLCKASSSNDKWNFDFSRINQRQSSYGSGYRQRNEERDSLANLDFSNLKNGFPGSGANSNKFKVTGVPGPGPKEREIIELFRKIQTQLRERAPVKQERKVEIAKKADPGKESEAVDSLLMLLRDTADKGSRKVNGSGGERGINVNSNQSGQIRASEEGKSRNFFKSGTGGSRDEPYDDIDRPLQARPLSNFGDDEPHDIDRPPLRVRSRDRVQKPLQGRPASNFMRKSPVPRVRYEPITSPKEAAGATPSRSYLVEDPELEPQPEFDDELEMEPGYVEGEMAGDLGIDESSDSEEVSDDEDGGIAETKQEDLSSMNLQQLKAMAKSRGMTGYSKMKKSDLVGLLSQDPSLNQ